MSSLAVKLGIVAEQARLDSIIGVFPPEWRSLVGAGCRIASSYILTGLSPESFLFQLICFVFECGEGSLYDENILNLEDEPKYLHYGFAKKTHIIWIRYWGFNKTQMHIKVPLKFR